MDTEKQLVNHFKKLNEENQKTLMAFAKFLSAEQKETVLVDAPTSPEPKKDLPIPEGERVVAAMKRLSATYSMINKTDLLDKSSQLMSEHMLYGKPGEEVIETLELLFEEHYKKYCDSFNKQE